MRVLSVTFALLLAALSPAPVLAAGADDDDAIAAIEDLVLERRSDEASVLLERALLAAYGPSVTALRSGVI